VQPTAQGWLWSDELGLYLGIDNQKLRLFTTGRVLVPLPEEDAIQQAQQERQRAEQERQRAEQERQRAEQAEQELLQEREQREQLLTKLRSLSPEQLKTLGLDLEE
jgi:restriction endonuclease Mrr